MVLTHINRATQLSFSKQGCRETTSTSQHSPFPCLLSYFFELLPATDCGSNAPSAFVVCATLAGVFSFWVLIVFLLGYYYVLQSSSASGTTETTTTKQWRSIQGFLRNKSRLSRNYRGNNSAHKPLKPLPAYFQGCTSLF